VLNTAATILKAVPILAQYGDSDPSMVRVWLIRAGLTREQAMEVTSFIPLAFGRELLRGMGVNLSDSYVQAGERDGTCVERKLADEPMFSKARALVPMIAAELGQDVFTAVALQSSELRAVNEALNHGVSPDGLVASPPIVIWPDGLVRPASGKRPWWKVW
jgi:hypothetical protein